MDQKQQVVVSNVEGGSQIDRKYRQDLERWRKNVDKNRAWLALVGLWLIGFSISGPLRIYGLVFAEVTRLHVYTREQASEAAASISAVEFLIAPVVSIFITKLRMQARYSMLIGGLLCALANGLAGFSRLLILDVACIGIIQGIGFAFVFVPFMSCVNSYFDKYRNVAFGFALSGGTMAVLTLVRPFQWLLTWYPWRYAYFAVSLVDLLSIVAVIMLKPNPKPDEPHKHLGRECQTSIFSERVSTRDQQSISKQVVEILKTPPFYLIIANMCLHFWVMGVVVLAVVDLGRDRGCSKLEAESLVVMESTGELAGRVILSALTDLRVLPKLKHLVPIVLIVMAVVLLISTEVWGFYWMAFVVFTLMALNSYIYVLNNSLFVRHLGVENVTLAYGMSSFFVGLSIVLRPQVIGYFRDHLGSYDGLMWCLTGSCVVLAACWLIRPWTKEFKDSSDDEENN